MKVLHTSDWHIGRALYGHNRYEECEAFLSWSPILIQGIVSREENWPHRER
jgi:exonuclease SbcD